MKALVGSKIFTNLRLKLQSRIYLCVRPIILSSLVAVMTISHSRPRFPAPALYLVSLYRLIYVPFCAIMSEIKRRYVHIASLRAEAGGGRGFRWKLWNILNNPRCQHNIQQHYIQQRHHDQWPCIILTSASGKRTSRSTFARGDITCSSWKFVCVN